MYGYTLVAATTSGICLLDGSRAYSIAHDGVNSAGTSDTNTIYMSTSGSGQVLVNNGPGADLIKLTNGRSIVLGPGVNQINYVCASGGPTFLIIPNEKSYGKY
jgi:hypothetical protein